MQSKRLIATFAEAPHVPRGQRDTVVQHLLTIVNYNFLLPCFIRSSKHAQKKQKFIFPLASRTRRTSRYHHQPSHTQPTDRASSLHSYQSVRHLLYHHDALDHARITVAIGSRGTPASLFDPFVDESDQEGLLQSCQRRTGGRQRRRIQKFMARRGKGTRTYGAGTSSRQWSIHTVDACWASITAASKHE